MIMTADGPRDHRLDRYGHADAALGLGRCHVTLSELVYAPEGTDPGRPRALNAAVQSEVCAAGRHVLRGADGGDGALPAQSSAPLPSPKGRQTLPRRERLIQRVEATLRSED